MNLLRKRRERMMMMVASASATASLVLLFLCCLSLTTSLHLILPFSLSLFLSFFLSLSSSLSVFYASVVLQSLSVSPSFPSTPSLDTISPFRLNCLQTWGITRDSLFHSCFNTQSCFSRKRNCDLIDRYKSCRWCHLFTENRQQTKYRIRKICFASDDDDDVFARTNVREASFLFVSFAVLLYDVSVSWSQGRGKEAWRTL